MLHYGSVPGFNAAVWDFRVWGEVEAPLRMNWAQFNELPRTKLVMEIAGRQPEPRVIPASAQSPRISCTIGERMWQDRWGTYDFR